jgi:hypothetical protein
MLPITSADGTRRSGSSGTIAAAWLSVKGIDGTERKRQERDPFVENNHTHGPSPRASVASTRVIVNHPLMLLRRAVEHVGLRSFPGLLAYLLPCSVMAAIAWRIQPLPGPAEGAMVATAGLVIVFAASVLVGYRDQHSRVLWLVAIAFALGGLVLAPAAWAVGIEGNPETDGQGAFGVVIVAGAQCLGLVAGILAGQRFSPRNRSANLPDRSSNSGV